MPAKRAMTIAVIFLSLLPFLLLLPETLGLRVFYLLDIQNYFIPYHQLAAETLRSLELPLWNPYTFSGIPLLADGQTAMFFPPNWLFLIFTPEHALGLVAALQFAIAGVGAFLFSSRLRLNLTACLFAGIVFMFSAFLVTRVIHLSILAGAALIPWIFWSLDELMERRSPKALGVAALAVAFQALAGHPQIPVYTALAAFLYVAFLAVLERSGILRALCWFAATYVFGFGLAAVQLVPWFDFARDSPRAASASFEFITSLAVRPIQMILLLFPYGFGAVFPNWMQPKMSQLVGPEIWERSWSVGLVPLTLAGLSVVLGRREHSFLRTRWIVLVAVLGFAVVFAAGSYTPAGRLFYLLPVVGKLRGVARALAIATFALSILAAIGMHLLAELVSKRSTRPLILMATATFLAVVGIITWANVLGTQPGVGETRGRFIGSIVEDGMRFATPAVWLAITMVGLMLLLSLLSSRMPEKWVRRVVFLLASIEIFSFAASFNPSMPPGEFRRVPDTVRFLKRDSGFYRTASFVSEGTLSVRESRERIAQSSGISLRVEDINGFNSLQSRRYTDLLFGPKVEDVSYGVLTDFNLLRGAVPELLDVRYAITSKGQEEGPAARGWKKVFESGESVVFQNPEPVQRAWFVKTVQTASPVDILQNVRMPGFAAYDIAYVEDAPDAARLTGEGAASVTVERPTADHMILRTKTTSDRLLVLSEIWFPGWNAEYEGGQLPIYRTDYVLRGIPVPAGEHTIHLRYRPMTVAYGAAVSLAAALALIAGCRLYSPKRG